jgi:hypothetical protein
MTVAAGSGGRRLAHRFDAAALAQAVQTEGPRRPTKRTLRHTECAGYPSSSGRTSIRC